MILMQTQFLLAAAMQTMFVFYLSFSSWLHMHNVPQLDIQARWLFARHQQLASGADSDFSQPEDRTRVLNRVTDEMTSLWSHRHFLSRQGERDLRRDLYKVGVSEEELLNIRLRDSKFLSRKITEERMRLWHKTKMNIAIGVALLPLIRSGALFKLFAEIIQVPSEK